MICSCALITYLNKHSSRTAVHRRIASVPMLMQERPGWLGDTAPTERGSAGCGIAALAARVQVLRAGDVGGGAFEGALLVSGKKRTN